MRRFGCFLVPALSLLSVACGSPRYSGDTEVPSWPAPAAPAAPPAKLAASHVSGTINGEGFDARDAVYALRYENDGAALVMCIAREDACNQLRQGNCLGLTWVLRRANTSTPFTGIYYIMNAQAPTPGVQMQTAMGVYRGAGGGFTATQGNAVVSQQDIAAGGAVTGSVYATFGSQGVITGSFSAHACEL